MSDKTYLQILKQLARIENNVGPRMSTVIAPRADRQYWYDLWDKIWAAREGMYKDLVEAGKIKKSPNAQKDDYFSHGHDAYIDNCMNRGFTESECSKRYWDDGGWARQLGRYLPKNDEAIQLDPQMYVEHPIHQVREKALKLLTGED